MSQTATFKLRCVGCQTIETRPAHDCHEQPFCNRCYMPMVLEEVSVKNGVEAPRKRPKAS